MHRFLRMLYLFTIPITIHAEFKLGIENIPQKLIADYKKNKTRIGLVTNHTGKDQKGNRNIDLLLGKGFVITHLFAPEHGFDGTIVASKDVSDKQDQKTGLPIVSIYKKGTGQTIDQEIIANIDAFFFDMQDSGMRHYTYISTLYTILQLAAQYKKKVVVFDRPNPLGKRMEGPLVEPELISFISIAPIPLRHGMTIGELADYFNKKILPNSTDLQIVTMQDYDRTSTVWLTHLSPNINCQEACFGYSFLGLLGEVKPFNVGVNTPHAFRVITFPESVSIKQFVWQELAKKLKSFGIGCQYFSYQNEHKKELCTGLLLEIANINQVASFDALLKIIMTFKKAGIALEFNPAFDTAIGTSAVRSFLNGLIPHKTLIEKINNDIQAFFQKAQSFFKYKPHPELIFY